MVHCTVSNNLSISIDKKINIEVDIDIKNYILMLLQYFNNINILRKQES